jgi:hypothetical protein
MTTFLLVITTLPYLLGMIASLFCAFAMFVRVRGREQTPKPARATPRRRAF